MRGQWFERADAEVLAIGADITAVPVRAVQQALAALAQGDTAARDAAAQMLVELGRSKPTRARFMVAALAALGQDVQALQLADEIAGGAGVPPTQIFFQPALANARTLPEFAALTQRLGMYDYWRQSRRLPDFCSTTAPPPLCTGLATPG